MDELSRAERYLFILFLFLIVLAYFAGATKIIQAGGPQLNSLLLTAQGRTAAGQFAGYPANAPAVA